MTVDPGNPALIANADASLERMFAHELHHAARWDGPGYGMSLGEALVSEGLAGHFAREVCGDLPEPWEQLPDEKVIPHVSRAAAEWDRTDYDHRTWFFAGGNLPRWLGYSLGTRIVGRYLDLNPGQRASGLAQAEARDFRACLEKL